jgi:hypothetical protein
VFRYVSLSEVVSGLEWDSEGSANADTKKEHRNGAPIGVPTKY